MGKVGCTILVSWPTYSESLTQKFYTDAKVGEFILRGPNIMKCYVGDTVLSESPFTLDGFLRTGDIGYTDNEGYLYIVDRAKEMIKVKGLDKIYLLERRDPSPKLTNSHSIYRQQVAPAELEAILITHPQVKDAAVCGVYNQDATSEAPVAYITTDVKGSRDQQVLQTDVAEYVNGQVSRYKRITGRVHILPAIPRKCVDSQLSKQQVLNILTNTFRSPSGKILRRLLPANLAAAAARPSHATLNTRKLARL